MKKVLIIIRREYLVRVRTRAFMIGTIVSPLLMLALTVLPIFFATRGGGYRRVTVLDQSGDPELFDAIKKSLESRGNADDELNRRDPGVVRRESANLHTESETIDELGPQFPFFGIHGAHQDEPRGLAGGNTITLDRDPAAGGRVQQKIDDVIRQQIDFIDIQDAAVGSGQEAGSQLGAAVLQYPREIQ